MSAYVSKIPISDLRAKTFELRAQKTMYDGKSMAAGDIVFLFASENEGGAGLFARGVVIAAKAVPKKAGVERQTPRVDVSVRLTARAERRLGREELKSFTDWDDGRPETELNFRFYRQATNKVGGISDSAARFISRFF